MILAERELLLRELERVSLRSYYRWYIAPVACIYECWNLCFQDKGCGLLLPTGIGRAVVKALAQCGAEVIAFSRTQADLDSLKQEVCVQCSCISMCECFAASSFTF